MKTKKSKKKLKKETPMGESRSKCQVSGCIKKVRAGWASSSGKSLRICMGHMRKHITRKDGFNFYEVIGENDPRACVDEAIIEVELRQKEESNMKKKTKKSKKKAKKAVNKKSKKSKKKTKKSKKKTLVKHSVLGKSSGVGIFATWTKVFKENRSKKLTDEQILVKMKKEFPGRAAKSKVFSNVAAHRRFYNNGLHGFDEAKVQSVKYG